METSKKNNVRWIPVILLLILVAAVTWFLLHQLSPDDQRIVVAEGSRQAATTLPSAPQLPKKLKVGLMCSQFTATGPHWSKDLYGYGMQTDIARQLRDPSIEMYWLIEPGSAEKDFMPDVLMRYPHVGVLNATDPDDLRKLDVIIAKFTLNMQAGVIDAFTQATKDGVGFIDWHIGTKTPGYTPEVQALNAMSNPQFWYTDSPIDCVVLAEHPLLGTLAKGTVFRSAVMGPAGEPRGTTLIAVKNRADLRFREDGVGFFPLFVSQLGKGWIVHLSVENIPPELDEANDGRFLVHCVHWLAAQRALPSAASELPEQPRTPN